MGKHPFAWATLAILFAGCSSDERDPLVVAAEHAASVRELPLVTTPPARTLTREQYLAEANARAAEVTDEDLQTQHDAYGRLGYFPKTYDLRAGFGAQSDLYIATYDSERKAVTLVGSPDHTTIVHELVHAIQDQRFDLKKVDGDNLTSDEALARASLVEGDARLAEIRDYVTDKGWDVIPSLQLNVDLGYARTLRDDVLGHLTVPPILAAHASFVYGFGTVFVGALAGLPGGAYRLPAVNQRFAPGQAPASTEEVWRGAAGQSPDTIRTVGLANLPASLTADWEAQSEDRLGLWYSFLLLYTREATRLPVPGVATTPAELLAPHWDGDQLLLLRRKDHAATAVAWTSTWDDESSAASVAEALRQLQNATPLDDAEARAFTADDGEPLWIEQTGKDVVLVKNLDATLAKDVASAALGTQTQRRHARIARPLRILLPARVP